MAKSSYHGRKKRSRLIWLPLILVLAGLAVWIFSGNSASDGDSVGLEPDPTVITPTQSRDPSGTTSQTGQPTASQGDTRQPESVQPPAGSNKPSAQAKPVEGGATKPSAQPPVEPTEAAKNYPGDKLFSLGSSAFQQQKFLQAGRNLSAAVQQGLAPKQETLARQMINEASDQWLFSIKLFEGDTLCKRHQVASGELLMHLQKQYQVPYQMLMRINKINDARSVGAGRTIKVIQGPFHAVVERKRFLMSIFLGDMMVKSYPVGLGAPGRQTPTGMWLVELKQENPEWTDPETRKKYLPNDPENPLGDRWVRLKGIEGDAVGRNGFGIHGTVKPEEIGQATSRGCIRLHNGNVRFVYDLLMPGKSQVKVVE
ncbi:MAG: L,D-transpeptidase family protein [Sedimentisphaerales bacterium]|nr:L,D-transpeptidase family protein [Sedimentisphaerales bacterium]